VNKAAIDTLFNSDEMQQALAQVRASETMPGPEKGRFYLWALNEAVGFVTRGSNQEQTDAYPWKAGAPGFEEWRSEFESIGQAISLLSVGKQGMLDDFNQFLATRPEPLRSSVGSFSRTAVANVFADFDSIRTTLNDIDKQSLLKRPYSFPEGTHGTWILILVLLAFITGALVPMALLATNINQSTIAGISLLLGTLAFSVGSVALFGWDVLHKSQAPKADYVRDRWRTVLLPRLAETNAKLQQGGLFDRDQLLEAKAARESASFPPTVRTALDHYLQNTDSYNQTALTLNRKIVDAVQLDSIVSARLVPVGSLFGQMATLTPIQVCDDQVLENVLRSLKQNPQQGISFEIQMPRWSRVVAILRPSSVTADNDSAIARLRQLGRKFEDDPLKRDFDAARDRVRSSEREFHTALQSWK
jgi:hypothetical protein